MTTKVEGGYRLILLGQLANVCALRKAGQISFLELRVWLAVHEQQAKRCTAKGQVKFTVVELMRLIRGGATSARVGESAVRKALDQLAEKKLLFWSETEIKFPEEVLPEASALVSSLGTNPKRPVPIPRYILRALFRHTKPAEVLAALAHLIRCLFKKGKEIVAYGLVKASWVAEVFGIAERSVHAARRWLVERKMMVQETVNQKVLNRWGGKFIIQLKQIGRKIRRQVAGKGEGERGKFAPPIKTISTLISTYTNQNNKPAASGQDSGISKEKSEEKPKEPTIKNIQAEDLKRMSRLEELYRQAILAGWLLHSEANIRNFVCAAARATRVSGNAVKIFVGIVKKKLFHHITQAQEDHALGVLRRYREKRPEAFEPKEEASEAKEEQMPASSFREVVSALAAKVKVNPVRVY